MLTSLQTAPNTATAAGTTRDQRYVLGLALALRLLVLWDMLAKYPKGWLFTRGEEMGLLAKSILRGQGLASPFGPPTGPTAFVAPGYPVIIAGVFKVFGSASVASEVFVILVQILLNLLTIWLMMHVARKLFGQGAATLAGFIWAAALPLLWMPTIFWDTCLAVCLLLGFIALVLRLRDGASAAQWAGLGAYCAIAGLVSPVLLLEMFAMLAWLAWRTKSARRLALAGVVFAIVFSPWPIRNARVFHAFIPLRTTVGFELWMGNRPGATGYLEESLFPSFNQQELDDYRSRGELGYTTHKSELAKEWIFAHPLAFVILTTTRFVRYWLGTGSKGGSPIFAFYAAFTSISGFLGLLFLFRSRQLDIAILFSLPLLLFPLPYYITHAEFRYRLMLDPVMTLLAAYAIVTLYRRFSHAEWQAVDA